MRKTSYYPYILLIFFLFFLLSISKPQSQKIRCSMIACISPYWAKINGFQRMLGKKMDFISKNEKDKKKDVELENALLKDQIEKVYEWLLFDQRLDEQLDILKTLQSKEVDELYWKEFFRRRAEELRNILEIEIQAVPAKIIFREPCSWSSSVWINIGEKTNEMLGRLIVGKNSPVVVGDCLIGVVEHVGENQSRVRLLTDSGFVPSVRALRGSAQDRSLLQLISALYERLYAREDLFADNTEKAFFYELIEKVINQLKEKKVEYYLAKGELHGASAPLWRSYGQKLKGVGFNYAYQDQEGPARNLATGKVLDDKFDFLSQSLLQKGDLLVTTGLDGIFPSGLKVAVVTKVEAIEEGDFSYNVEAKPTALDLFNLNIVFVMPPLGFEK